MVEPLVITTANLANGQVDVPYSQTLMAEGGTPPYTWSLIAGTLPSGLILNPATGQISGTPTVPLDNSPLTFNVADSTGPSLSATATLTFLISPSIWLQPIGPINPGDQVILPLSLSGPAPPDGVSIALTSSNKSVVSVTPETFISAGILKTNRVRVTGVGNGSAIVTATALGYSPACLTIQVGSGTPGTMNFSPSSTTITVPGTQNLMLLLSQPAPTGDLTVNLSSNNTAVATLPASVKIAANGTSATVPVAGVAAGLATISATAQCFGTATANVAVVGGGPPTPIITATGGTPQSTLVNTTFPGPLIATVMDGIGNPMSGVGVMFMAPASGPSGTFAGGGSTVAAMTNGSGVAMSPPFTANSTTGSYTVLATAPGASKPASFALTNQSNGPTLIVPANLVLNVGDQVVLPIALPPGAPSGAVTISVTTSNPLVASVPTSTTIPDGSFQTNRVRVTGVSTGAATITASAPGFNSAMVAVQVQ
jgi:hypothetical protein